MSEPPSPSEVNRRLDDLRDEVRSGLASINARLVQMPTSDLLMAHLSRTDAEIRAMSEDIADVRRAAMDSIAEAKQSTTDTAAQLRVEIAAVERRSARAWVTALSAVGLGVSIVIGVLGLLVPMIGGS